jgi:hypothetical protein
MRMWYCRTSGICPRGWDNSPIFIVSLSLRHNGRVICLPYRLIISPWSFVNILGLGRGQEYKDEMNARVDQPFA